MSDEPRPVNTATSVASCGVPAWTISSAWGCTLEATEPLKMLHVPRLGLEPSVTPGGVPSVRSALQTNGVGWMIGFRLLNFRLPASIKPYSAALSLRFQSCRARSRLAGLSPTCRRLRQLPTVLYILFRGPPMFKPTDRPPSTPSTASPLLHRSVGRVKGHASHAPYNRFLRFPGSVFALCATPGVGSLRYRLLVP